jgi:hypothetical protein
MSEADRKELEIAIRVLAKEVERLKRLLEKS